MISPIMRQNSDLIFSSTFFESACMQSSSQAHRMARYALFIAILASMAVLTGCTFISRGDTPLANRQPQTQLQTRQYQTREYDTNDVKLIMKAVLNTLQDDGFVVKNAVVDLGLISAQKDIDLAGDNGGSNNGGGVGISGVGVGIGTQRDASFWQELFLSFDADRRRSRSAVEQRTKTFKMIEATINVSDFGKQSRVRASFQAKYLDQRGNPLDVYAISDAKFYQDFFVKVDKGIFIQKQKF